MLTVDFDWLGLKSGERLLDAGCGEGRHSIEGLIRGARVWGMDMDMPSLLKARFNLGMMAKAKMTHPEGRYLTHIGDARHLPFPDETFDRVICSEVMEHVDDDNRACAEMVRVLKTGGTIAITVPTYFTELKRRAHLGVLPQLARRAHSQVPPRPSCPHHARERARHLPCGLQARLPFHLLDDPVSGGTA